MMGVSLLHKSMDLLACRGVLMFKQASLYHLSTPEALHLPAPVSYIPVLEDKILQFCLSLVCVVSEVAYQVGQTFPASDGCNTW